MNDKFTKLYDNYLLIPLMSTKLNSFVNFSTSKSSFLGSQMYSDRKVESIENNITSEFPLTNSSSSIPFSINGLKVCTYNEFNIVSTEFHFGLDLV